MSSRHVGLSNKQRHVPPLLSVVRGKPSPKPACNQPSRKEVRKPIPVDAEPISDNDDDDDGDGGGLSRRGDIISTKFGREPRVDPAQSKSLETTGSSLETRDRKHTRHTRHTRNSTLDISAVLPGPSGSKRSLDLDSHVDSLPDPQPSKPSKKQKGGSYSNEESQARFQAKTDAFREPEKRSHRRYGNPAKSLPAKNAFRPVEKSSFSSPERPQGAFNHNPAVLPVASSPTRLGSMKIPPRVEEDPSDLSSPVRQPSKPSRERPNRIHTSSEKPKKVDIPPEDDSPMAEFKMPSFGAVDLGTDFDLGPIQNTPKKLRREVEDPSSPEGGDETAATAGAVCPMCNEQVDRDLLDSFTKGKRMTIAQQQKFCQHHNLKSARNTWVDKGYPDIDWRQLESRISKRHGILEGILEGRASHYGDKFTRRVKAGKSKTVLKTKQSLTPGYYGIRGLRLMTETIINHFSSLLRKRAVQDRLISARGYTAYVQAVLVPELAVRLIMEDMGVSEVKARSILQESIWIGELLNEEVGDVVPEDEDEDEDDTGSLSSLSDVSGDELVELE